MARLQEMSFDSAVLLRERVLATLAGCRSVEEAARNLVRTVCTESQGDVPLARVYVTIPYGKLPAEVGAFAQGIAASVPGATLAEGTPVLTLLGTHGDLPAWQDRRQSAGHVAIPLLSSGFVSGVPMIASLLKQFGVDLALPPGDAIARLCRLTTPFSGAFYVEDASSAKDELGREVIPAQGFVREHGIVSVLGSGALQKRTRQLVVLVLFARCRVPEREASYWWSMASHFVGKTSALFESGALFDA